MSDEELPAIGTTVSGKYVIEQVLGRGGMGAVLGACNLLTGRRVAIKWIRPWGSAAEIEQRLMREAKALGRIEHPNVVQIFDVGREGACVFLVMERLEGRSLRAIAEGAKLDAEYALALLLPAFSGVAAAHLAGVIHRDLKPENLFVLLDEKDEPYDTKVLDFGISKLVERPSDPALTKLTRTGTTVGTPHYMSPEQLTGAPVDGRADVYALAVILYELLAGRLPYDGDTYAELVVQVARAEPVPLSSLRPDLPRGLIRAIERGMSKRVSDRDASVEELARALEPFAGGVRFEAPRRIGDRGRPTDLGPAQLRSLARATAPGAAPTAEPPAEPERAEVSTRPALAASPVDGSEPDLARELPIAPLVSPRAIWVGGAIALALCGLGGAVVAHHLAGSESAGRTRALAAPASDAGAEPAVDGGRALGSSIARDAGASLALPVERRAHARERLSPEAEVRRDPAVEPAAAEVPAADPHPRELPARATGRAGTLAADEF